MSYLSLARKYRPNTFADLVGQESVGLALSNAIRLKREPRGVIFTGVRGIGKTTTARIYAKALNCEKGPTPEPCNVCASCLAIQHGTHEDVLEIDGASNTGVDDVRALQETLAYVPQRSPYKVYIIDEVHMLSVSAFNALLKTLEEPPEHVVFIFATTELHKVPETIQSRCQIFHLQKISTQLTKKRIADILTAEHVPFEDRAIQWIAREGKGSLRDALTLLDQVIAVGGGSVQWEAVEPMVNTGHAEPVYELLKMLLQKNMAGLLAVIARWDQEGLAMTILVEELVKACRNAFILKSMPTQNTELDLLDLEDREQETLRNVGKEAQTFDLNRIFRTFVKCLDDLRNSELDRFVVENYAMEWCLDPGLPDLTSLFQAHSSGGTHAPQVSAPMSAAPVSVSLSLSPTAQVNIGPQGLVATPPLSPPVSSPTGTSGGSGSFDLRNRWKQTSAQMTGGTAAPSSASAATPPSVSTPTASAAPHVMPRAEASTIPSYASGPVKSNVATAPVYAASPIPDAPIQKAPEPLASEIPTTSLLSKTNTFADKMKERGKEADKDASAAQAIAHAKAVPTAAPQAPAPAPASTPARVTSTPEPAPEPAATREIPEEVKADIPVPTVSASSGASTGKVAWPETWKHFVDEWKKQKPLQARVLEETYSLEYTPQRIKLAVEAESLAGQKLLHLDTRKKLLVHFEQLFGFKGILDVIPKGELAPEADNEPEFRETLLETKQKIKAKERDDLKNLLQEHPLTREAILAFDGTIEAIEVQ
ncbi:MAG: DNA polymerase III subunit gamma/tau [Chitinophagaceae bacterium]|nr:DNA polymerase III subunit gamma/tau [Oligoflexus sp.]